MKGEMKTRNAVLTYHDEKHTYVYAGKPVRSVTQVLSNAGVSDMTFVPESALLRGREVHDEIMNWLNPDAKLSDFPSLYFRQAQRFLMETRCKIIALEKQLYSKQWNYAGRLDLIVELNERRWVLDWKLNSVHKACFPQIAAYKQLWNENKPKRAIQKAGIVKLTEKSYELIDADGPRRNRETFTDWQIFERALKQESAQCKYQHV